MREAIRGSRLFVLTILSLFAMTSVNAEDRKPTASAARGEAGVTVRVAAISLVPRKFDLTGNANRLEAAFRDAHRGNSKIAVAPEGSLDGYTVNEIIAGEVPADRMYEVAIEIEHGIIQRFQKLAAELEMCLVFGFAERIGDDVFNCANLPASGDKPTTMGLGRTKSIRLLSQRPRSLPPTHLLPRPGGGRPKG